MSNMLSFRLDDIAPGLNRANLDRFEEIFDSFSIKPLIGVVPDCKDPNLKVDTCNEDEFWKNVLRLQDKGWTVALHGYQHVYCNDNSGMLDANPFSEFAGLDYEEQVEKISKGLEILRGHGIVPSIFMAPGHTFDVNTLNALVANGIFKITDGYSKQIYKKAGITFYPCKLSEPKTVSGIDTVCIHLNNWKDEDFKSLVKFINKNIDLCVGFDELLRVKDVVAYDKKIVKQEEEFRILRAKKQKIADDPVMQNYLKESYSDNKCVKLIKRAVYSPMLLKR